MKVTYAFIAVTNQKNATKSESTTITLASRWHIYSIKPEAFSRITAK